MNSKFGINDLFPPNTEKAKYLFVDVGGVVDGIYCFDHPRSDDLLLEHEANEFFHFLPEGLKVIRLLEELCKNQGFRIVLHSKNKEEDQINFLRILWSACMREHLWLPEIYAIAVYDSEKFKGIRPDKPLIKRDTTHGIIVVGYGSDIDGKCCVREALSSALGILPSERKKHFVFDDGPFVIKCALREGWNAFEVTEQNLCYYLFDCLPIKKVHAFNVAEGLYSMKFT